MKDRFYNEQQLAIRALEYIETKLIQQTKAKKQKQTIQKIIKEQVKNKTQLHFSIFALLATLPYTSSQEQEYKILKVVAEKIAQFQYESDYLVWEFILMRGQTTLMQGIYFEAVYAMCWTLKYNFGIIDESNELGAIKSHFRILIAYRFDFFFNRFFYPSLYPLKVA